MGQYYKPLVLADKQNNEDNEKVRMWMYSHDYNNGLKLMEHSWVDNDFVRTFESTLCKGQPNYKKRVVWAGDYADGEAGITEEYEGKIETINLHGLCKDENQAKPDVNKKYFRYVVNHTKKTFVDKSKTPKDKHGYIIHPLPLLTCEGNGRGGGDFHEDSELVGAWARDMISVTNTRPKKYTEIVFDLHE
jgi:hypothetical protein